MQFLLGSAHFHNRCGRLRPIPIDAQEIGCSFNGDGGIVGRCPDVCHARNADELFEVLGHELRAVVGDDPRPERELIRERVCAGVKNARQKGKRLGRPKRVFDRQRVMELRQQGRSFSQIARELGIGLGTVVRAINGEKLSKIPSEQFIPSV